MIQLPHHKVNRFMARVLKTNISTPRLSSELIFITKEAKLNLQLRSSKRMLTKNCRPLSVRVKKMVKRRLKIRDFIMGQ